MDDIEIEQKSAPGDDAGYWLSELEAANKREQKWHERGSKIVKRYEDERDRSADSAAKFNILWSNTEVLKAALYSSTPQPDVRRRHKDSKSNNPLYRAAADMIERCLSYSIDAYDMDNEIAPAVEDLLLPGRGTVWVDYEAEVEGDKIGQQKVCASYVYWKDYRQGMARTPAKVPWKARAHYFSRSDLKRRFPEHGEKIALTHAIEGVDENKKDESLDHLRRAKVWEIWDKASKKRFFVAENYKKILRQDDDPLGLRDFFPCPNALYAVKTTSSQCPIPEFVQYQDQANELDRVNSRIFSLVNYIKFNGIYDASGDNKEAFENLMRADDGTFVPHLQFEAMKQSGGMESSFGFLPIDRAIQAIRELIVHRNQILQAIYEITGISDIIRGATDPRETKGAQQLKAQFGSMRMQYRQNEVQRFCRDVIRIKAEIISEHFTPENLKAMSNEDAPTSEEKQRAQKIIAWQMANGQQPTPELVKTVSAQYTLDDIVKVLRSDKMRSYNIDVETDSTVLQDAEAEKAARAEFMTATSELLGQAYQAAETAPAMLPVVKELTLFGIRSFKAGRSIEQAIEDAFDKMGKEPPKQEGGDEAAIKQAELALKKQELQGRFQIDQAKIGIDREKLALDRAKVSQEAAGKGDDGKMAFEQQKHADQMELEVRKLEQGREIEMLRLGIQDANEKDDAMIKVMELMQKSVEAQNRPKKVVRDENGRVSGVE